MTSAVVDRARALLTAGEYGDLRRVLRTAAEAGDAEAALELGWLLSLRWDQWAEVEDGRWPERWEPEWWLSRAARSRPDDPKAQVLLAGLWARMADSMSDDPDLADDEIGIDSIVDAEIDSGIDSSADAEIDSGIGSGVDGGIDSGTDGDVRLVPRFRATLWRQAAERYTRVLAADPACVAAASGLLAARAGDHEGFGWDPETAGFSFLICSIEARVDNQGNTAWQHIVVTDPDELRWALAGLLGDEDQVPIEHAVLNVFQRGQPTTVDLVVDPDEWDWAKLRIPHLMEPLLPFGHPVFVDDEILHFGYHAEPPY
ncbi:hypothetical protein GCM10022225_55320 [Plantactinospora mayteni]|uniref:Uncharacterized protein n=1 Tax=Plantactinospora mayteni TaxID=566021 RepID=A0ABQ4EUY8_9ACTN|nr:hypothetical protein [Plantactinospora mayteni]GIG98430.1 hypothetical protein Pma05_50030 [Plantactinospora mayteni]